MLSLIHTTTLAIVAATLGLVGPAASSTTVSNGKLTYVPADSTLYGACGDAPSNDAMQLALPENLFGDYTNGEDSPACGKSVTITSGTVTATATVFDQCDYCATNALDVSEALFGVFAPLASATVSVSWTYDG